MPAAIFVMAYDADNTYATVEQLRKRITTYGSKWAVDVDTPDRRKSTGEAGYETEALEYANTLIDEALQPHLDLNVSARSTGNSWLADRGVDIAAYRVFTLGGREAPDPLRLAYDEAVEKLEGVREGSITIPGFDYAVSFRDGSRGPRTYGVRNVR